MNIPKTYRQGDVLIVSVEDIPKNATPLEVDRIILAHGEVTGHAHAISSTQAQAFIIPDNNLTTDRRTPQTFTNEAEFLDVPHEAIVTHEEHGTIELPSGKYKIIHQREYSPEEIRRVLD